MSSVLSKITTPFGLLGEAVQEQLRLHGGPYEFFAGDKWVAASLEPDEWLPLHTYRVKPAPIIVTHDYDAWLMPTGWVHAGKSMQEAQPVRIIFDRIDGAIDPSSYRVVPR